MASTYNFYRGANFVICFGLIFIVLLVVVYLCWKMREKWYGLIKQMFGIKGTIQSGKPVGGTDIVVHETLDMFGAVIDLHSISSKWQLHFIRASLCITTAMVIAATLIVFVDGIILNVTYLKANNECPSNGNMDCFMTRRGSSNHTYFFCNSSDTQIPQSFGRVTCYRWWKDSLSTVDILNQIGLCAGVIQVFSWIVNLYLRLLIWAAARSPTAKPTDTPAHLDHKNYQHPYVLLFCFFLSITSPVICLIVVLEFEISVTGITIAILSAAVLFAITMVILTMIWRHRIDKQPPAAAPPPVTGQNVA